MRVEANGGARLQVRIGRKFDQPVQDAYRLEFGLRPVAASPDYFESRLSAASRAAGHARLPHHRFGRAAGRAAGRSCI